MRILAVLLLILNAGFLAWQQGWLFEREIQSPGVIRAPFRQAPQALVMLSEIPAAQRELMDQISASEQRAASARQQLDEAEEEVAEVRDDLAVPDNSPASDEQGLATAEGAPEGAGGETMAEPALPWCATAGVFADEVAARAYIAGLEELGGKGVMESRRESVSSVWWVHLPAFASEAEARRMLAELQDKGIDSFYMADGELAGGISLGVFSREASAKTAQAQFAARGYTASIAEVDRLGIRLYVAVELPDATLLASPEWAAFQASGAGLQVTEKLCEVIAPENVFP